MRDANKFIKYITFRYSKCPRKREEITYLQQDLTQKFAENNYARGFKVLRINYLLRVLYVL